MYRSWPCPMPDGTLGEEMLLAFDRTRDVRILIIPPLFEEANKFRHQTFEFMRILDERCIDCMLPDLPGCNESLAPQAGQTLGSWRKAVAAAASHVNATHAIGIRSGCWLMPPDLPGWSYAPVEPARILKGLVRARMIASREVGIEETSESILDNGRSVGLEMGGWHLGAELVREFEAALIAPTPDHIMIEHSEIGGKPLWLSAENTCDLAQAKALADRIGADLETV